MPGKRSQAFPAMASLSGFAGFSLFHRTMSIDQILFNGKSILFSGKQSPGLF